MHPYLILRVYCTSITIRQHRTTNSSATLHLNDSIYSSANSLGIQRMRYGFLQNWISFLAAKTTLLCSFDMYIGFGLID